MIEIDGNNIIEDGLYMDIEIMPSIEFIKDNHLNKIKIPIVSTKALFDTGAKLCAVDQSVIDSLNINPCQMSQVKTPFGIVQKPIYKLIFKIPGKKEYFPVTAVLADLSKDNYKAIIGRNFLRYCVFIYDGANEKGYLNILK